MLLPALVLAVVAALVFIAWTSLAGPGAVATFFTAAYIGLALPVLGLGIALQVLAPRVALLIFAAAVGLGILAAAPFLVRRPIA